MALDMTVYREPGVGKDGMFVAAGVEFSGEIVHCHMVADGNLTGDRPPPTKQRGRSVDRVDVQQRFEPMAQSDYLNARKHVTCQPRIRESGVRDRPPKKRFSHEREGLSIACAAPFEGSEP